MKFAVISDIHSNLQALETVLEDTVRHNVKKVFCLGDLVGYGANPAKVIDHAYDFEFVLRGNHDDAVTFKLPKKFNPMAAKAVQWTRKQIKADPRASKKARRRWSFMRKELNKVVKIGDMLFAHGTPESYFDYIDSIEAAQAMFTRFPKGIRTLFVGHTHVAGFYVEDMDGFVRWLGPYAKKTPRLGKLRLIVNVGSVGQPRDCDIRASYVLASGDRFYFRRIPYDVQAAAKAVVSKKELPRFLGERLLDGS